METPEIEASKELEVTLWPSFLSRRRHEFHFVKMDTPDMLRVNRRIKKAGETHELFYNLGISDVDSDTLKFLGIWGGLSKEVQEQSVRIDEGGVIESANRMEHARKHRRNKYPGVQNGITCSNCGAEQKMVAAAIVKNAEKWALKNKMIPDIEKWIKQWKCQKCNPTKGRRVHKDLPPKVELVCKCGAKVVYPSAVVAKTIAKKSLTLEAYISGYRCQTCNPTKGRKKGKLVKK